MTLERGKLFIVVEFLGNCAEVLKHTQRFSVLGWSYIVINVALNPAKNYTSLPVTLHMTGDCGIFGASLSFNIIEHKCFWNRVVAYPICQSVCRFVQRVYCGKTADCIRISFGVVSEVGRGMGVLDGDGDHQRRKGSFGVKLEHVIETSGDFVVQLCENIALFLNYFGEDLLAF